MKSTLSLRNWEKIFRLFYLRKCPIAQASWFWTEKFRFAILVSGRACGRHAPTRKLWKHAGVENQNKRGLCVSGYFSLGRNPLFACYDFLKKDVWSAKCAGIRCMWRIPIGGIRRKAIDTGRLQTIVLLPRQKDRYEGCAARQSAKEKGANMKKECDTGKWGN